MAWSDREDVDLAQMIRDKVADRKEYIKRFKRTWHDIEIHGSKFMGHDMSLVVSSRKKREHIRNGLNGLNCQRKRLGVMIQSLLSLCLFRCPLRYPLIGLSASSVLLRKATSRSSLTGIYGNLTHRWRKKVLPHEATI